MIVFNFNQSVWKTDHDCSIRVEGVPFYFSRFTNLVILWSILAVACIAFTLRLVFQAFWINFADTAHVFSTIVSIAQFLTYDLNHVPFFTWKSCLLLRINGTWQTVVFSCMVKHWHVMLKRCLLFINKSFLSIFRIRWEVIQQKALLACIKKNPGSKRSKCFG